MATAVKRGVATKVAVHIAKRAAKRLSSGAREAVRDTAGSLRERTTTPVASRVRRLPIQVSLDVAAPVAVAWDEWMTLESLPEGMHHVEGIERDGDDLLVGRLSGVKVDDHWEAEILDEREDESFAWRSSGASDCAGLITFHELSERLTRIELELDVNPSRLGEAAGLAFHVADRRAERELWAFKARVEKICPDDYPALDEGADDQEEMDE
jgi:uncharacterized membrane protein